MATITADMVKELREKTGAGMMDCKKALAEADGNMEQAIDELRKRGQAIAQKKGARATKEGLIFAKVAGSVGVLVELGCETDFVARNEEFKAFGAQLAELVASGAVGDGGDVNAVLEATLEGKKVADLLQEKIAKIGENLAVARYVRVEADGSRGPGQLAAYIHPPGKLGVLVELHAANAASLESAGVQALARDLAMQVAAASPLAIDRSAVPAEKLERERAIYLDQTKMEGKPEKMWDKIVEGKLNKFYKQTVLTEQEFVKDPDLTIAKLLEKIGKEVGDTLAVTRFERFEVGGGQAAQDAEAAQ